MDDPVRRRSEAILRRRSCGTNSKIKTWRFATGEHKVNKMKWTRCAAVALASVAICGAMAKAAPAADQGNAQGQAMDVTVPPRATPVIPAGNAGIAAR